VGRRNGSIIGKRNVGAGATSNASGVWGLNDTQRVSAPDNSSALESKVQIQYLLVGGGGGGAGSDTTAVRGGGGGAGGMKEGTFTCYSGTQLYIQVGNGGAGGSDFYPGSTGTMSRISSPNDNIKAFGGGGGKGYNNWSNNNDRWGASGGGLDNYSGNHFNATPGYVNQGNPGGYLYPYDYIPDNRSASGGGGAGDKGGDADSSSGGDGGIGRMSYISGAGVYYAGGGGGGARNGHSRGYGGAGGGGNGGVAPASTSPGVQNGYDGQANTGGGGGGAATGSNSQHPGPAGGGDGGSGIVILRYPNSIVWSGGTGLTYGSHTPIPGTDERYIQFTDGNGYITITTQ
tara:strand:- start:431 stop:1465 length:1035 start_codon:yes stop_codon:yes gene_type:complete